MARAKTNTGIDTKTKRKGLEARREPYWTKLSAGRYLGYRKASDGAGTWVARYRTDEGKQAYQALGAADDLEDADGTQVLDNGQAQARARAYFERMAREDKGQLERRDAPYTVREAIEDYFKHRSAESTKPIYADRRQADARILPALGHVAVDKLTARTIRKWRDDLALAPRLVRTKAGASERATRSVDRANPDAVRARQATANRVMTILKAALNHAYAEGLASSDEAWKKTKTFKQADAAVIAYLSTAECQRLVNACRPDLRALVRAALLTGCRYGELCRMEVRDFNMDNGTVRVRESKSGDPRSVVLTGEGIDLLKSLVVGKAHQDRLFIRESGAHWKPSDQQRPLAEAAAAAAISPAPTFHVLRHTHASMLAMRGVPMGVIATQLGHKSTRITEKHYAHLAPSYVADTIRASFPDLDLGTEKTNVKTLR